LYINSIFFPLTREICHKSSPSKIHRPIFHFKPKGQNQGELMKLNLKVALVFVATVSFTGCSVHSEMEWEKSDMGISDRTKALAGSEYRASESKLKFGYDGRVQPMTGKQAENPHSQLPNGTEQVNVEDRPTPPPQIIVVLPTSPTQIVNITNNVHIGDNHQNVHLYSSGRASAEVPRQESSPANTTSQSIDPRCERQRLEHEATVRMWRARFR
jgi:hypothetical protein